jgi:hypothetical protein
MSLSGKIRCTSLSYEITENGCMRLLNSWSSPSGGEFTIVFSELKRINEKFDASNTKGECFCLTYEAEGVRQGLDSVDILTSNSIVPTKKAASENADDTTIQRNLNSLENLNIFPWNIITTRPNGDSDLCDSA